MADSKIKTGGSKPRLMAELQALAEARKVPLRDDRDLAALVSAVDIQHEIPVAALTTIAGLLAHLYRANQHPADGQP
ncbi:MAG TPA: hypothetical protein VKY65_16355 [Alphaproteobacteria bacterium]|nr:hypothetical protein [Alphaproteobacteria bacterium]